MPSAKSVDLMLMSDLASMFHEGGSLSHIFAKRINLPGTLMVLVAPTLRELRT